MKRKADFVMRNVGGENLLLPIGAQVKNINGIITLNDTGAYLWELLALEQSLDELAEAVGKRFNVAAEVARLDVQSFVNEIFLMGILEL